MSAVRLVDAVGLAKRIENIDITVAGEEAKWNDAKSTVLREIADSPTHDLSALIKAAQAEAVIEFTERLKAGLIEGGIYPVLVKNVIEMVKKEMLGEG